MNDVTEITQLVLHERQGRDRGWWAQMEACFHPDSLVVLSWFNGKGAEFVARSRMMSEAGFRPVHRPSPPVVHVTADRAVVELPIAIDARFPLDGVEVDLTSYSRLLYQVMRTEGSWKIKVLNSIYERDTVAPVIPGTSLNIDQAKLAQLRKSYRWIAYHNSLSGRTVPQDLYGDDQPEQVDSLYASAFAWMREAETI